MSTPSEQVIDVAVGAETGRRVAWAAYYRERQDKEKVLEINYKLQMQIAELCLLVTRSEAIQVCEPEGPLALRACSILGALRRRAKGSKAIKEVMDMYKEVS